MTEAPRKPTRFADAEGTMHEAPVVYTLVHALDHAITGELVLTRPDGQAHHITFFEGAPVRVEPGLAGERIGEALVAAELLADEALARAIEATKSSRKRMGELLVQDGAIDPALLTSVLGQQTAKRLSDLANMPADSTFALYLSARVEPEPLAPWTPLDSLLAAIRAWEDRERMHGTLRWLADKDLRLRPDVTLDALMLTDTEREAIQVMSQQATTIRDLYAQVGRGLSSLLYMLAVTRQLDVPGVKGEPMGRRKVADLVNEVVQAAVPVAPVIASPQPQQAHAQAASGPPPPPPSNPAMQVGQPVARPQTPKPFNPFASFDLSGVVSPHAQPRGAPHEPAAGGSPPHAPPAAAYSAPPPAPAASHPPAAPSAAPSPGVSRPSQPARRRVSIPASFDDAPARPVRVAVVQAAEPPPPPPPPPAASAAPAPPPPPVAASAPPPPAQPRPSAGPVARPSSTFSPPKFVDPGRPPARMTAPVVINPEAANVLSSEFRLAEQAVHVCDWETAERILQERCSDEDMAEPRYQALQVWVRANLHHPDVAISINDLTVILMGQPECEDALYYRGLLNKRIDREKAALRDFVTVAKLNAGHMGALTEIKLLRDAGKRR